MKEIEVKVIEIDKEKIRGKLLDLGAKKVFEGNIEAIGYDFENEFLMNKGALLRLRKKGNKIFLTYKKKITQKEAKVMEEIELEISDFDTMNQILLELNFKPLIKYAKKRRITYKIEEVLFEIDEYEDIPAFMEIEAPTIKIIQEYVEKLGIDKEKVKSWTGLELLNHYGKI